MRRFGVVGALVFALSMSCSLKKMTAGMTVSVAKDAGRALDEEADYEFASRAAPGNLKFLEGLYYVVPDNEDLLFLLTKNYASYAFGFLEEGAATAAAAGKDDREEKLLTRAVNFYEKAGRFGLKLLGLKRGFDNAWKDGGKALDRHLAEYEKSDVGKLFWVAYAWLGAIKNGQDRIENLAMLPKVVRLVKRAVELDGTYFFGGPHLLMGGYYMSLPKALGGSPSKAKAHFDKALAAAGDKALLPKVMYASLYASKTGNKALVRKLIDEVKNGSIDALPSARLANVIAKRKAARLAKGLEEQ